MIRSNGFENSISAHLENILAGDLELLKQLVGLTTNHGFLTSPYNFSKSFVAIAAPSLEGKTQLAFLLEKARPLYFSLGARGDHASSSYSIQPIYLSFKDLNRCIEDFAKEDVENIIKHRTRADLKTLIDEVCFKGQSKSENSHILLRLTSEELNDHHKNKKLYTLGLFYKLVEDARMNYDTLDVETRPAWMEYHANRTNFNVSAKSLHEIPTNFFEGYSLFLDEFRGHDWAIFIRNLARAVGLRCCVSNTNAKVANLVGKHQSRMSGSAGEFVWSIVVTELKMANYQVLNSLTSIDGAIGWIRENVISDEYKDDKNHFDAFFKDFKENQIQHMRPGVSLAVAKFLNMVCACKNSLSSKVTFESFFTDLVNQISEVLAIRKPYMKTSVYGKAANLSLMLSPSYNRQKYKANLNSSTNHLEDHFYYLINPSNASNWLFLTFPSEEDNVSSPLDIIKGNERTNWKAELTFFKSGEILTILACMNLFYYKEKSFNLILDGIFKVSAGSSFDIGSTENPLAEKRDGNRLEVLSTLCSSHSSHHDPLVTRNSFKGQCGSKFFMNLLSNLMTSRSEYPIELNYAHADLQNFNIQKYLEDEILIPFLYVSNFELPQVFHEIMENSDIRNRSINMGKLTRTADQSRIDIQFPFYYCRSNQKYNCKIECKNWKDNVLYSDLLENFKRAQSINQPSISVTICDEIGNPMERTDSVFSRYCYNNQINAYRFSPSSLSNFYLVPLSNYLSDSPSLIAIVIELKVISARI